MLIHCFPFVLQSEVTAQLAWNETTVSLFRQAGLWDQLDYGKQQIYDYNGEYSITNFEGTECKRLNIQWWCLGTGAVAKDFLKQMNGGYTTRVGYLIWESKSKPFAIINLYIYIYLSSRDWTITAENETLLSNPTNGQHLISDSSGPMEWQVRHGFPICQECQSAQPAAKRKLHIKLMWG